MYLNVFMLIFSFTIHFVQGRKLIKYLICIYISIIYLSLYSDFAVENIYFAAFCHIENINLFQSCSACNIFFKKYKFKN